MLRGHDADDDLRVVERGVQIAGRCNRFWQDEPGQEALVDPVACDAFGNFRFVSPELDMMPDMMSLVTSQHDCQPGAPGACTDDGNAAHRRVAPNVPDFISDLLSNLLSDSLPDSVPNFDSVPAARRPMFWRCLQMTSAETKAIKTSCRGSTYSWRAHASSGKAAATAMEPSET